MSLNVSQTKYIIFHVQGKRIDQGTTLQIDANLPDTAHKPDLVTTVERIHSKKVLTMTLKPSKFKHC